MLLPEISEEPKSSHRKHGEADADLEVAAVLTDQAEVAKVPRKKSGTLRCVHFTLVDHMQAFCTIVKRTRLLSDGDRKQRQ
jgi:hypothetical protein